MLNSKLDRKNYLILQVGIWHLLTPLVLIVHTIIYFKNLSWHTFEIQSMFVLLNSSLIKGVMIECVSELGFPPEFRVTVYVRKWSGNFFHFHYGKGSGKPEYRNDFRNDFFSVKRKFPERCLELRIVSEYRSGNFRFPEHLVTELH